MNIDEAISSRRSVRDYTTQQVAKDTIHALLDAAVHAPTARHEEPWEFVIIQNKQVLNNLSADVKELLAEEGDPMHPHSATPAADQFPISEFNAFYTASTLIVIYAKPLGAFVVADCWLAAQNLMLAAYGYGLGSCVIGLAVTALNTPKWKKELGVSMEISAVAPIIVGVPAGETPSVTRKLPEILTWL
jgi:nitroreductase